MKLCNVYREENISTTCKLSLEKNMNKNLKLALIAASAVTFVASAHDITNALVNSSGSVVKNSFGQCVEVVNNAPNVECGAKKAPEVLEVEFNLGAHTLFNFDKSNLRPEGKAELQELASKIKEARDLGRIKSIVGVNVVGHTDSVGSVAYNQGLSERRAASVRNYLVQLGVSSDLITASGEGELNPVASNSTAEGRQQNRRVNITVQGVAVETKDK